MSVYVFDCQVMNTPRASCPGSGPRSLASVVAASPAEVARCRDAAAGLLPALAAVDLSTFLRLAADRCAPDRVWNVFLNPKSSRFSHIMSLCVRK